MRKAIRVAAAIVIVLAVATHAAACPTCGDNLAQNDPQGQGLAAGIYYSILFMMSMPYLILATFGCIAYLSIRRARLAAAANSEQAAAFQSPAGVDRAASGAHT